MKRIIPVLLVSTSFFLASCEQTAQSTSSDVTNKKDQKVEAVFTGSCEEAMLNISPKYILRKNSELAIEDKAMEVEGTQVELDIVDEYQEPDMFDVYIKLSNREDDTDSIKEYEIDSIALDAGDKATIKKQKLTKIYSQDEELEIEIASINNDDLIPESLIQTIDMKKLEFTQATAKDLGVEDNEYIEDANVVKAIKGTRLATHTISTENFEIGLQVREECAGNVEEEIQEAIKIDDMLFEQRVAEIKKQAEEKRLAEQARRAEEERIAAEKAHRAEQERLAKEAKLEREAKIAEIESTRKTDAQLLEEFYKLEAQKKAAEEKAKKLEQERLAAEKRQKEIDEAVRKKREAKAKREAFIKKEAKLLKERMAKDKAAKEKAAKAKAEQEKKDRAALEERARNYDFDSLILTAKLKANDKLGLYSETKREYDLMKKTMAEIRNAEKIAKTKAMNKAKAEKAKADKERKAKAIANLKASADAYAKKRMLNEEIQAEVLRLEKAEKDAQKAKELEEQRILEEAARIEEQERLAAIAAEKAARDAEILKQLRAQEEERVKKLKEKIK